uniref:Reelin n=1 Tax=Eptatretus burgeri TaxID=7764 RepID=A0A8C4RCQ5_EPTBU
MCMGRGWCSLNGCSCDVGFYGDMCEITKLAFMAFLSQSFSGPSLPLRLFHTLHGATLGLSCGLLAEGKALVFNGGPYRELVTTHLDTTVAKFLQFTLRLGTTSGSSCPAPDHSKEGVLLDFSTNNGLTWQLLAHYHPAHYHEPRIVSLELPSIAQHNGMQLRWWQPHHSGEGQDVWALDELTVTSTMYSAIYLDFSDLLETTDVLSFFRGQLQPHCGHDSALSFTGETWEGVRYVETQSLAVSSSFMLQFEFVANCDSLRNFHQMNPVRLEFSTNHGLTWSLVQQKCLPGMPSCDEFRAASEFYPSQFKQWQRVTMALPAHCWSSSTRFRWQQGPTSGGKGDMWALDDLYIGQACPAFCHNHGHCNHGTCRCDEGFVGSECLPREWSTPQFLHCDFESAASLFDNWIEVAGGNITRPEEGCGLVTAGSALFFHKDGVRHAVTRDFDTSRADFVQFTVHIGGNSVTCNIPDRREEGVLLQFSTNGGISWRLLIELYYMDYSMPRFVHQELPTAARGPCTRFRWWQPQHSGDNKDQWSIDSVIISSSHALNFVPPLSSSSYQSYQSEFPAALSDAPVWLDTANEGMPDEQPFCSPRDSALVFGKSDGDRFAITRDFEVLPGFVLQFQLNIGCDSVFKTLGSVHVQFSCDTGRSWSLVQKECYPATLANQGCEGQSRKLHEASVYPAGIFPHWTRVTIPLPHTTANRKTRFRWFQHSSMEKVSPPFALDQVYVAHPCPMDCAEHVCSTDSGETCVAVSSPISDWVDSQNAVDRFEGSEPGPLWKHIHGGRLGGGCGQLGDGVALYFSGAGKREAVTVPLDTSNIRMMQFYIRIGSQNLGAACLKAKARNEGVVLQFSRNGDVSWSLLRELDFASFLEPQLVTLELPPAAKGVATYFRWWQPQHGRSGAQWALDDVLIGVNDSSLQNLQDKFEKPGEDGATWFRVEGGHIQSGCSTNGHVLLFDSNSEKARLAETWDVHVSSSTFLQFELSMGCGRPFSKKAPVELQFSVNFGRDWQLVRQGCVPPDIGCTHYETSSVYQPGWRRAWSRIMLYLPYTSISSRTRFRWIQHSFSPGRDVWALDNVYIGSGCPWMCSGHGACDEGQCRCDMGFKTPYCVPLLPLPYLLKETFDSELKPDLWFEVLGSEIGQLNGQLISSGSALIFNKDGLRMLVTKDLDCSKVLYIQFTFCFLGEGPSQRSNGVLLQFSINGGISWQFLEELYMPSSTRKQLVTITLPHGAQTNATRFRLWQPRHKGKTNAPWTRCFA